MTVFPEEDRRALRRVALEADLVVVGGGLAGTCCAITAAREGVRVALLQDRPVLGGNASSEVRLWALGATSHMGNNNRWAREGGLIDELLVENTYRNPEGNPYFFDALLHEKASAEKNLTLLLNTSVFAAEKRGGRLIRSVQAFNSQNATLYDVAAPLFCDASGDGVLGYLSGASFRIGAESRDEFGERFAPRLADGGLLGHTIFFYSKDAGRPVTFVPPAFALRDIRKIPRFGQIASSSHGCAYWWLEFGGSVDTVHDTESIKWELWRVVYGVWNHIKNSGAFPDAANLTLEWVGAIPGKRESRRFEGDYMLTQQDVVERRAHADAVSFGGWAIDLHPVDGVYSRKPGCVQWHSKGVYPIPYRCLYSRNVRNLFLAGRDISVSHVAFGSTRVMATCAHAAQAVGVAAALCRAESLEPRALLAPARLRALQQRLLATGQHIPGLRAEAPGDFAPDARVVASSAFALDALPPGAESVALDAARALLVPAQAGRFPAVTLRLSAARAASLVLELRACSRVGDFTPDVTLATARVAVPAAAASGAFAPATVDFGVELPRAQYVFVCLMPAPDVRVQLSDRRVTGVLALVHGANRNVAKQATQTPPRGIGVDAFEFWIPERRPAGKNLAAAFAPPLRGFGPENLCNGFARPGEGVNAWVAAADDPSPTLTLRWEKPRRLRRVEFVFDTDFDHAMESVQWGHPERAMPFCVRRFRLRAADGRVLAACDDNHQTRVTVKLAKTAVTDRLVIDQLVTHGGAPVALFAVRCYG